MFVNTNKLKAERIGQGKSVQYMSDVINKTYDAYARKERGDVKFTTEEMALIANDLSLSPTSFNEIFFDSKLPFGNSIRSYISEL